MLVHITSGRYFQVAYMFEYIVSIHFVKIVNKQVIDPTNDGLVKANFAPLTS